MININNNEWINKTIKELNFKKFTDIQAKTIPLILKNQNVVGVSETGTGKTYCFLLPILNKIDFNNKEIQAIIIAPTRELARQLFSKFNDFKKHQPLLKTHLIIGGSEFEKTIEKVIKTKPQIIIATPEKLLELNKSKIKFNEVKTIVFDEADMLIDLGFISIFNNIFDLLKDNKELQKIAFSATLHEMLLNQISIFFKNTKIINVSENIWTNKKIVH
ncbi:MAG: DEAD/DEAH box helicase family protein, partial [Mycoplasmoidaceae bacterium]